MRLIASQYKTFGQNGSEKKANYNQLVWCSGTWRKVWNTCCPCWKLEVVKCLEDETPLTEEVTKIADISVNEKPTLSRVDQFATEGRKESRPYLDSISKINPVPNITLAKWEKEELSKRNGQQKTGAIPKNSPVISRQSRSIVKSKREISAPPHKGGIHSGSDNNDASEISSKSGTPSPLVSRVGMGVYPPGQNRSTSDLLRDFREPSVCSRASSGADTAEIDEKDGNEKFGSQLIKAGSLSSLGTRSESMASVYSQGEGRYGTVAVRGDVEFGFIYNFGSGSLDISIKQCKDLAAVDLKRNRSDPYVKVYLLPDRSKAGKRKTKVKKHTLNPIFEEILKFVMPLNEVERRTMWISVWHSDMFGRNDFLGEVMMPMTGQVFDDPSSKWYSLQDRTEPPEDESVINSKGDIIVALKYVPSEASPKHSKKKRGTLMILIKEAKNLPVPKGTTLPDPYCKCYLLPSQPARGKQKTGICRRTTSPRWEQTICWDDLTIEDVADRSLELAIWDHDRLGHQDFLGGARFNLGTGKHGGRPTTWMDATGKEVTLWQQMLDRPNFWVEGSISLRAVLETTKPEK